MERGSQLYFYNAQEKNNIKMDEEKPTKQA